MSNITSIQDRQDAIEAALYVAEEAYWKAYAEYNTAKEELDKALEAMEKYV